MHVSAASGSTCPISHSEIENTSALRGAALEHPTDIVEAGEVSLPSYRGGASSGCAPSVRNGLQLAVLGHAVIRVRDVWGEASPIRSAPRNVSVAVGCVPPVTATPAATDMHGVTASIWQRIVK